MLKNIGNLLERKKKGLISSQNKKDQVALLVYEFLRNKFGEDLMGFQIDIAYNTQENSLVINTKNKTLANEITFLLDELANALKKDGVKLARILVR